MPPPPDHPALRRKTRKPLRIVVLGYIIRGPLGGLVWHHLQYVVGLIRLGHDVLFIEDSDDYASCVHLDRDTLDTDPTEGMNFARGALKPFGADERFAYFDEHTNHWLGPACNEAEAFCRSADCVLNLSGVNPVRPWWADAPVRVLVDTDPAFTQITNLQSERARARAEAHNAFFTFGERFGQPGCTIPDDGLAWQPTRQPVVLDAWPVTPPPAGAPFTTVMQWDSYKKLSHGTRSFGMKSHSFEPYFPLPGRVDAPLLLGIGGASCPPRDKLRDHGWRLRNTIEFTRNPWQYRRFLQDSAGEFSVAKHGYVATASGWFSERSANYLASGRPVVVQDTGFSRILPAGEGLLAFQDIDQAAENIERVQSDWDHHAAAARRIAEEYFDAHRVLHDLMDRAVARASTGSSRS